MVLTGTIGTTSILFYPTVFLVVQNKELFAPRNEDLEEADKNSEQQPLLRDSRSGVNMSEEHGTHLFFS